MELTQHSQEELYSSSGPGTPQYLQGGDRNRWWGEECLEYPVNFAISRNVESCILLYCTVYEMCLQDHSSLKVISRKTDNKSEL